MVATVNVQTADTGLQVGDLSVHLPVPMPGSSPRWQAVVQSMSFSLKPGQIVGLVGESGSGKTLTGRALMGLLPHHARSEGRIELDQQALHQCTEAQWRQLRGRQLAMIFQDPLMALNPLRRVGSQLAEVLQRYQRQPKSAAHEVLCQALLRVRLADPDKLLRRYPHELSGGMRQRVMIAMALLGRPRVLIADEPTAALDPTSRDSVLDELKRACETFHCAVLLISHDLNVVERVCDHVLMMYAGRLLEQGPASSVLRRPRHRYTQALLAARPQGAQWISAASQEDTVPAVPQAKRKIPVIKGQFNAEHRALSGCVFAPRCDHARPLCQQQAPLWEKSRHDENNNTLNHRFACHFPATNGNGESS